MYVAGEMCTALDSVPFACVSSALEVRRKSDGATVAAQVSTLPALALRCALLLRAAGQRPGERRVSGTPDGSLSAATARSGVRRCAPAPAGWCAETEMHGAVHSWLSLVFGSYSCISAQHMAIWQINYSGAAILS